ncbi:hypothetical protein NDU88_005948 [Pleurodeles waltl]|uniref:Uncharacterized protein n=1 Tax=Pleurodeles waltl TaxID=8319 RepID=A0AAV7WDA7_PLEWA|nr:hypothetical protein NDU88_005948 [Pleurodeles waltl]
MLDPDALLEPRTRRNEVDMRLRKFDYQHYIARTHSEGDRSRRLLAWLIQGELQRPPIGAIQLYSGIMVNTQADINNAFKQYYSRLYERGNAVHDLPAYNQASVEATWQEGQPGRQQTESGAQKAGGERAWAWTPLDPLKCAWSPSRQWCSGARYWRLPGGKGKETWVVASDEQKVRRRMQRGATAGGNRARSPGFTTGLGK